VQGGNFMWKGLLLDPLDGNVQVHPRMWHCATRGAGVLFPPRVFGGVAPGLNLMGTTSLSQFAPTLSLDMREFRSDMSGSNLGYSLRYGVGRQQRVWPRVRRREPRIGDGDDPRRHGGVYEGRNGRARSRAALWLWSLHRSAGTPSAESAPQD